MLMVLPLALWWAADEDRFCLLRQLVSYRNLDEEQRPHYRVPRKLRRRLRSRLALALVMAAIDKPAQFFWLMLSGFWLLIVFLSRIR